MRLPDFLIIGAMKAGTTTLYRDLLENPDIFMPDVKEPNTLCDDGVLEPDGLAQYAALFKRARPDQKCGEASTAYTKLPDRPGVAERARKAIGSNLRVIYIVREPVARIVSHHHHSHVTGLFGPNIDDEVHRQPALLNYTRYAMQVRPWIEQFGRENVLIVKFEDYISDRRNGVSEVSRFIGVEPRPDLVDVNKVYNRSQGKPMRVEFWRMVRTSGVYRNVIAPVLPRSLRDRIRDAVHPKAIVHQQLPSNEIVEYVLSALSEDLEELRLIVGSREPLWPAPSPAEPPSGIAQIGGRR